MGKPEASHGSKFTQALRNFLSLIDELNPRLIAIEKPIAAGVKGSEARVALAFGYRAAAMQAAFAKNRRVEEYSVGSIRKHFIGEGKLSRKIAKERVMDRCKRLGWSCDNDNESDACAVWDYARSRRGVSTPSPFGLFDAG